ncbi:MAG: type I restriction-modification system subunit M [Firmicutes bacterium]|nr:type I restriction-modification system subunit M [Bacillota bacterium]
MPREKEKSKKTFKSLEATLWDAATVLRDKVSPIMYMDTSLGLIFLKYVSDRFEARRNELLQDKEYYQGLEEDRDEYIRLSIFWIPKESRWENIVANSKKEEIGKVLDEALLAIEKENENLQGILPKVYSSEEIDKRALGELIDVFNNQLVTTNYDSDFFGKCYEYFLGNFSKSHGQKGGEFYTPSCIVDLIVEMIEPYNGYVYDPACGSGGMFVHSVKFIKEHQGHINNISIYGQEMNPQTWRLAKMNLAIRGIEANLGLQWGDTFNDDRHPTLRADFVMANPPFNVDGGKHLQIQRDWIFGVPPKGNANYAWLSHIASKLTQKGKAGIVLANGSLSSNQKEEYAIRKAMVERDGGIIDCIVSLPSNLFATVTIPACLWFLNKNRGDNSHKILFIDARQMGVMIDRKIRELTPEDIVKITQTYHNWQKGQNYEDIKGYCKSANLDEIVATDYSLVPGRYVGIDTSQDMTPEQIQAEIQKVKAELKDLLIKDKELEQKLWEILNSED